VVFQEEEAGRRKWRSLFLWCRWLACMASGGGGERWGADLDRCMAGKGSPSRMDMVVAWLDARAECGRCGVDTLCFVFDRLNRNSILFEFELFRSLKR
jgi:hypothetical protein